MSPTEASLTPWADRRDPDRETVTSAFKKEGLVPRAWSNAPADTYGWHEHGFHKVLYCVSGSIVFHTERGDVALRAGDRLDLAPGTRHAATVGPDGVECLEAERGA